MVESAPSKAPAVEERRRKPPGKSNSIIYQEITEHNKYLNRGI